MNTKETDPKKNDVSLDELAAEAASRGRDALAELAKKVRASFEKVEGLDLLRTALRAAPKATATGKRGSTISLGSRRRCGRSTTSSRRSSRAAIRS